MRLILISAYHAKSHATWAEGLTAALDDHDWTRITLPPRNFAWRIRGSALSLLDEAYAELRGSAPDALVTTSMLDLCGARAWLPALRHTPALVYFHENQFAYPSSDPHIEDIRLLGLKTAVAADWIVFNSAFNRDTFFEGARVQLARMPDAVPPRLLADLAQKAEVVPVPLANDVFDARSQREPHAGGPLRLLWNHRWEYDKGPARLFRALEILDQHTANGDWTLAVCGQQFRRRPPVMERLLTRFADRITHVGFAQSRETYLALLAGSDVVISTALHDFQGLSVLEAVAAGCWPAVPDRLAYREWFSAPYRYASFVDDEDAEATALATMLQQYLAGDAQPAVPDVSRCAWPAQLDCYRRAIDNAVRAAGDARPATPTPTDKGPQA